VSRARKRKDVVPDRIIFSIPFNREPFLSTLCMFRQGTVGEAKSLDGTVVLDDVHDATGIQRIESQVAEGNRNDGSDL
jgi:hypothetical protein